jgi:hypothetical protein
MFNQVMIHSVALPSFAKATEGKAIELYKFVLTFEHPFIAVISLKTIK